MENKQLRLLVLIVISGFAVTVGWGQAPNARESVLPDFDIRDANLDAQLANEQARAAGVIERRSEALKAFQGSPDEVQNGTRVVPNRFGLPKVYRREGSVLTPRSLEKPEQIARGFLRQQS